MRPVSFDVRRFVEDCAVRAGNKAALARQAGIAPATVSHWLNGTNQPSVQRIAEFSVRYRLPLHLYVSTPEWRNPQRVAGLIRAVAERSRPGAARRPDSSDAEFLLWVADLISPTPIQRRGKPGAIVPSASPPAPPLPARDQ
jgi:transcriptional regulator with XRE-family HTH domain